MEPSDLLKIDFYQALIVAYGLKFVGAILIFFIGKWVVNFLMSLAKKSFTRTHIDQTLAAFIVSILRVVLIGLVIIMAFSQLGINTNSFAAMIAAAGLAIGLAFQGSLSNFSSGIMIVLFRFFRIGDAVNVAGTSGVVNKIDIFNTTLIGFDGVEIIVPNNKIISDNIVNYSSQATRRVDISLRLPYDADIDEARAIIKDILDNDVRVLKDPLPTIAVMGLNEFGVQLIVRPFTKTADYFSSLLDIQEKIQKAFRKHNNLELVAPPLVMK